MNNIILGMTGHRDVENPHLVSQAIEEILYNEKPKSAVCGVAIGADFLFAISCLTKKIPLIAAVPFIGQEKYWPEGLQKTYNSILNHELTLKVITCDGGFAKWKFIKRNEYIVDNSNKLLAIYDGRKFGGTYHCVEYAKKQNKEIIYINPKEFV